MDHEISNVTCCKTFPYFCICILYDYCDSSHQKFQNIWTVSQKNALDLTKNLTNTELYKDCIDIQKSKEKKKSWAPWSVYDFDLSKNKQLTFDRSVSFSTYTKYLSIRNKQAVKQLAN